MNQKQNRREFLMTEAQGLCFLCGKEVSPQNMSIHHVVPKSRGGSNTLDNLVIAHNKCNSLVANRLPYPSELERLKALKSGQPVRYPKEAPSRVRASIKRERNCFICDTEVPKEKREEHYIIPLSLGGKTDDFNTVLAHRHCARIHKHSLPSLAQIHRLCLRKDAGKPPFKWRLKLWAASIRLAFQYINPF